MVIVYTADPHVEAVEYPEAEDTQVDPAGNLMVVADNVGVGMFAAGYWNRVDLGLSPVHPHIATN